MPKTPELDPKKTSFVLKEKTDWEGADDDDWESLHLTTSEAKNAGYVGQRRIDGCRCHVFAVDEKTHAAQRVG